MGDVNQTFFLSLCVIGLGYLFKRLKILNENDGKTLSKIIFNITLPGVILYTIPTIDLNIALVVMPMVCIAFSTVLAIICWNLYKNYKGELKGVMLMATLGFNVGNFAYPLVEGVWGIEGLQYIAMFDVGNAIVIFIMIYIFAAIHSPKMAETGQKVDPKEIGKKIARSIPLMCYFIGLIINGSGAQVPIFLNNFFGILARANMAIVLLTLGIFLNFNFEKSEWKNMWKVIGVRYIAGISVGLLLYYVLPFEPFVRLIIFVSLIIPIGMAIITYGVEFEYSDKSQQIIGTLTNITMIISFFLMWILILLLN
jgi:hypothetical protein